MSKCDQVQSSWIQTYLLCRSLSLPHGLISAAGCVPSEPTVQKIMAKCWLNIDFGGTVSYNHSKSNAAVKQPLPTLNQSLLKPRHCLSWKYEGRISILDEHMIFRLRFLRSHQSEVVVHGLHVLREHNYGNVGSLASLALSVPKRRTWLQAQV